MYYEVEDGDGYLAAHELLLRRCEAWAEAKGLALSPLLAAALLDSRHFSSDGGWATGPRRRYAGRCWSGSRKRSPRPGKTCWKRPGRCGPCCVTWTRTGCATRGRRHHGQRVRHRRRREGVPRRTRRPRPVRDRENGGDVRPEPRRGHQRSPGARRLPAPRPGRPDQPGSGSPGACTGTAAHPPRPGGTEVRPAPGAASGPGGAAGRRWAQQGDRPAPRPDGLARPGGTAAHPGRDDQARGRPGADHAARHR